jgi:uncharacterized paraquat-inducible protein A
MMNVEIASDRATAPQLHATLWRCDRCNSFVAIHSVQVLDEALCPACGTIPLQLCGTFNSILGLQFADA